MPALESRVDAATFEVERSIAGYATLPDHAVLRMANGPRQHGGWN